MRRNGVLCFLTVFEPSRSPCCFLWFQSHPNPARTAVCTHSQTWGWKKGAKIQIFAANSPKRKGQPAAAPPWSCSLLLRSGCHCSSSPRQQPWKTRKVPACLSPASQPRAGWVAGRLLPKLFICLKEGPRRGSKRHPPWLGGWGLPPLGEKEAPSTTGRLWTPKGLPMGLARLCLL